jgi:hypothetical protein
MDAPVAASCTPVVAPTPLHDVDCLGLGEDVDTFDLGLGLEDIDVELDNLEELLCCGKPAVRTHGVEGAAGIAIDDARRRMAAADDPVCCTGLTRHLPKQKRAASKAEAKAKARAKAKAKAKALSTVHPGSPRSPTIAGLSMTLKCRQSRAYKAARAKALLNGSTADEARALASVAFRLEKP